MVVPRLDQLHKDMKAICVACPLMNSPLMLEIILFNLITANFLIALDRYYYSYSAPMTDDLFQLIS